MQFRDRSATLRGSNSIDVLAVAIGLVIYLAAKKFPLDALLRDPQFLNDWQMPLQIAAAIPMTLCDLGLVLLCRRFLDRRSGWSLGLGRPGRSLTDSVPGGFLIGFIPMVFVIGTLLFVGGLDWHGVSGSVQTALLVPTLMCMAFNEEILCRGYLLQNLIDIRRPVLGIIFSSMIFWLLHALNPAAWSSPIVSLNLFGAGVVLALAYRVSRNIWFPTAAHFGWNFAQGALFEVPISGVKTDGLFDVQLVEAAPAWMTGGAFGIEGSLLATGAELAMSILLTFVWLKRPREIPSAAPDAMPMNSVAWTRSRNRSRYRQRSNHASRTQASRAWASSCSRPR
jgi:hypothetical protein